MRACIDRGERGGESFEVLEVGSRGRCRRRCVIAGDPWSTAGQATDERRTRPRCSTSTPRSSSGRGARSGTDGDRSCAVATSSEQLFDLLEHVRVGERRRCRATCARSTSSMRRNARSASSPHAPQDVARASRSEGSSSPRSQREITDCFVPTARGQLGLGQPGDRPRLADQRAGADTAECLRVGPVDAAWRIAYHRYDRESRIPLISAGRRGGRGARRWGRGGPRRRRPDG